MFATEIFVAQLKTNENLTLYAFHRLPLDASPVNKKRGDHSFDNADEQWW